MTTNIKVQYCQEDKIIDTKYLSWPQNYEDFIKDILKTFNLRNSKLILKLISDDDDISDISSPEEFDDYLKENDIKECKFFTDGNPTSPDIALDDDEDLEKIFDSQINIKEINVDNIINDVFNIQTNEKKIEEDNTKYSNIFKTNLEESLKDIIDKQKKIIEKDIDLKISEFSNLLLSEDKAAFQTICVLKNDINKIKEETDGMFDGLNELYKNQKYDKDNNNNKDNNKDNKDNIEMSNIKEMDKKKLNQRNQFEYNNDEENELNINFNNKRINEELDIKKSKFFTIDNIIIKNTGNNSYRNLCYVIDEVNSDKDIKFFGNDRQINMTEITMNGDFEHNDELKSSITLTIKNPEVDKEYKLIIQVKEKNKNKILSHPLEIYIKLKQYEDPIQQKQNKAILIYEELRKGYPGNEDLINKDEIIDKYMNDTFNKDEFKKSIDEKIKEKEEKQNEERAESIYNKLNIDNIDINKNEIMSFIKQQNFDEEKVKNLIENKKLEKAEKIYNELSQLNDVKLPEKDQAMKKIIEQNYDVNVIKELYKNNNADQKEDPRVDEIYAEVDNDYGVSSFMDENVVKAKIKELNYDKEKVKEWVEEALLNNDN